jgi:hypothetical protein
MLVLLMARNVKAQLWGGPLRHDTETKFRGLPCVWKADEGGGTGCVATHPLSEEQLPFVMWPFEYILYHFPPTLHHVRFIIVK